MYVIVGLGNPGSQYERTRHNVGFMTIDLLAEKLGINVNKIKFKALIGEGRIGSKKVLLVKPQTYMNLSGESLREIVKFYKVENEKIFVIYDDIDLDVGKLRIRKKGSAGTHNGMRSIIYQLQFDDFPRFRIGVSKPVKGQDLASFVLSKFREEEAEELWNALNKTVEAVETAVSQGMEISMNKFNG